MKQFIRILVVAAWILCSAGSSTYAAQDDDGEFFDQLFDRIAALNPRTQLLRQIEKRQRAVDRLAQQIEQQRKEFEKARQQIEQLRSGGSFLNIDDSVKPRKRPGDC